MAQLLRTPKSGSDWTANELYVQHHRRTSEARRKKRKRQLLHYLDLATDPKTGQEAAVVNFAAELLKDLEYDDDNRIVFIRRAIPFLTCREDSIAQIDVCIMDDNDILLLLQEDKILTSMKDPEPQVIAEAIAAFALNNRKRERDPNLPPCNSIMFPCITMAGTTPVFYKITITAALSKAEQRGNAPSTQQTRDLAMPWGIQKFFGEMKQTLLISRYRFHTEINKRYRNEVHPADGERWDVVDTHVHDDAIAKREERERRTREGIEVWVDEGMSSEGRDALHDIDGDVVGQLEKQPELEALRS
ncbi:hypothetical protein EDB92DRAFT_1815857 [Lactarius akahatsu]|uniref:Uncharacterized protein n=1 Tax=Lactarius akahatsu TaxID=416441 RepID=A0AAD4LHX2_9AGAM|nr:hypothetical protein EDB92DRAFT_1815857 [Lactarius akahatsu]